MIGELPDRLDVNGNSYRIRTSAKAVLDILQAFNDPELQDGEKVYICLYILYEDFASMPKADYEAAYRAAVNFLDCGMPGKDGPSPRTMDWEQDAPILFPAINSVAGREVRADEHIHWWTFMGYFMEVRDGVFAQVLALRNKKAHGKKLEKWEQEFWRRNKDICVLKPKLTAAEQAEKERLNELLG